MNKKLHILQAGLLAVLLGIGSGCSESNTPIAETENNDLMTFRILHPRQAAGADTKVTSTAFENDRPPSKTATAWACSSPARTRRWKCLATM